MRQHHIFTAFIVIIIVITSSIPSFTQTKSIHTKSVVVICKFDLTAIPSTVVSHMQLSYLMSRTASPIDWAGDYNTFPELWTRSALLTINAGNRLSTLPKRVVKTSDIERGNARLIYKWSLGVLADSISLSGHKLTTWDSGHKQMASLLGLGSDAPAYHVPASWSSKQSLSHVISASEPGLIVFSPLNADINRWADLLPQLEAAIKDKTIDSYVLLQPVGSVSDGENGVGAGIVALRHSDGISGLLRSRTTKMTGYITLSDITAMLCELVGAKVKDTSYTGLPPEPTSVPNSLSKIQHLYSNLSVQRGWERNIGSLPSLQFTMLLFAVICSALGFRRAARLLSVWPYTIPLLGIILGTASIIGHWPIGISASIWVILTTLIIIWNLRIDTARLPLHFSLILVSLVVPALLLCPDLLRWTGFGYSAQEGARYYGIGNEVAGLITAAVAIISTRYRKAAVVMMGIWVIGAGLPSLGANVGAMLGVAAMMAAYLFHSKWNAGRRRLALGSVLVIGASIMLMVAYAFFLAPESHLGQFLHDPGSWTTTFTRKWAMNMKLLQYSSWSMLMWLSVALMLGLPYWMWAGVLALFFFNDSGVIAAATMASWLGVWHLNDETQRGPIAQWGDLGIRLRDALSRPVISPARVRHKSLSDSDHPAVD